MNIERALKRVGSDTLQDLFLPRDVLDLLDLVSDEDIFVPTTLRRIVLKNMSGAEILRNGKLRRTLIASMKTIDKARLANSLGIKYDGTNLDQKVLSIRPAKNSDGERRLFDFFGEGVPADDADEMTDDIESAGEKPMMYGYQRRARREIMEHLGGGKHRCLLHMPTGSGKTRVAIWAAASHFLEADSMMVVWLANREELCEQAVEEFKTIWGTVGDRKVRIFRLFGNHDPDIVGETEGGKGGFIVAGLQKMLLAERKHGILPILGSRVTLVVMDEAHMAVAPTYSFILRQMVEYESDTRLLGLSATPGRTWNDPQQDAMLADFFDRKKVTLRINGKDPIEYLVGNGYLAKTNLEPIEYADNLKPDDLKGIKNDDEIPDSILEKLSHDTVRNHRIVSEAKKLVNDGHRRVIIFGTTVQNSKVISLALAVMGYVSFHVDSGTPPLERSRIIARYKSDEDVPMILCNYGVFTAGFDSPKTTAVLIARPTQSLVLFSQMVGRATRGPKAGGTAECTVKSITDISLPGFRSLVETFNNWEDVW